MQADEIDGVFKRIRLALGEGILTLDSLKIYPDIRDAAEKAVAYLREVEMIAIDPSSGEISLNEKSPYRTFEEALRFYMPLWENSLEAFSVRQSEKFRELERALWSMSAWNIREKRLITLFLEIFEEKEGIAQRINRIKEAVEDYAEMSICDIKPYQEELMDELLLYLLLKRREPTAENPLGCIRENDAIGYFVRVGYPKEDMKDILEAFCGLGILRKMPGSEETRYAVVDEPKILLGVPKPEKKITILDKRIRSVVE